MSLIGDYSTTQMAWTHVALKRKILSKEQRTRRMKKRANKLLGDYIATHRRAIALSVSDAAEAAGVDASFWRKLENGVYESPSPKMLAPIARVVAAPLADVYALAGYETAAELPTLTPYLRNKYQLPPKALAELQRYFDHLRNHYGIPADKPVFPRKPRPIGTPGRKPEPRPTGGPWDDPTISGGRAGGTS
jgi:transcriptional regulator with XRE-family HTH domain